MILFLIPFKATIGFIVEPGDFTIMVGNSSSDVDLSKINLYVDN